MDDILDAAQTMFEEDGISQETVNELRLVGPHYFFRTTVPRCSTLPAISCVSDYICTALSPVSSSVVFRCSGCAILSAS